MARVDSGLFSDDSPCDDLAATPSSGLGSSSRGATTALTAEEGVFGPPKITPYSGVLGKGKVVIRPIAFKPFGTSPSSRFSNAGERYGSTPILARPGSQLTLYGSHSDLRLQHGCSSNYSLDRKLLSSSASPPLEMASLPSLPLSSGRKLLGYDSLESVRKSPHTNRNSAKFRLLSPEGGGGSLMDLTPSPSDSGVAELEAALRDRDSELAYLRQTMEHNEQVIFRVYQDKERVWERELRRMKAVHDSRLRAGAQKALKLEQMLMMQTYQLQQDKKRLRGEVERASREAAELRQEVDLVRGRLEETEWGLCEKSGELSLLKAQLKDCQGEQTTKGHELLQLRGQVRDLKEKLKWQDLEVAGLRTDATEVEEEMSKLRGEVERLCLELAERTDTIEQLRETRRDEADGTKRVRDMLAEREMAAKQLQDQVAALTIQLEGEREDREEVKCLQAEIQRLKLESGGGDEGKWAADEEILHLKRESCEERNKFERERLTWAQEKEKVLRYQRQLQLNYVQMFRKTRSLEAKVQTLSMEVELEDKTDCNAGVKNPTIELGHTIEI